MKCIGELTDIGYDLTGRLKVTMMLEAKAEDIEKLKDDRLSVEVKQYREHRSLEANSYYWALCSQIADVINQSVAFTHNTLLRRYGQMEAIDGKAVYLVLPDTDEAAAVADQAETYHIKPTSQVKAGTDGKMYRTYVLLKGSHDYDTKEMSRLIDGAIGEAHALGIDTITEAEKREMLERYGKKYIAR